MKHQTRNRILYLFFITYMLIAILSFVMQVREFWGNHFENFKPQQDTIVRIDTTPAPPIIIQLPRQEIQAPIIIYVDSSGRKVPSPKVDTQKHEKANLYQDSIEDENLTLYYESMVKGQLLSHGLDYKLKIPKLITKTIEIPKPYPEPVSAFFLVGGVGGNVNQFASITAGLQFVSSKGWSLGYDYDVLQNSHHVKLGVKLFQLKK